MRILLRLLRYSSRYRSYTALAYLCLLAVTGLSMLVPWLIRGVIDRGLGQRDAGYLVYAAAAIIVINVVRGGFQFGQSFLNTYVSDRVAYDLRNELYDHLQRLSFSYHDRSKTGELMSRVTSDVDQARIFTGQGVLQIVYSVLLYAVVLAIMFSLHRPLALLSLGTMPFLAFAAVQYGTRVRPMFSRMQRQHAVMTSVLQEAITGVRVVKAFAREQFEIERFERENWEYLCRNLSATRLQALVFPLLVFISAVASIVVLWYGGYEVVGGRLTLGTLLAFQSYLAYLAQPTRQLGMIISWISRATASGERLFEILDTPSPVRERPGATELDRTASIAREIRFDHVWFEYQPGKPVLRDISFEARPNQVVALVGHTGSGKSTVARLVPRFYDVTAGAVLIDRYDVRDVTLRSLRRQIGAVFQESLLFSATVAENIAYGRPGADLAAIEAAARAAQAHDFIITLSEGYDTKIGERGVDLSGGQRQRLAIARALLLDPPILILDEATASVDMRTEFLIQQALQELMEGRTTFVIAQRLTTIKYADLILVLDDGRIVERGRHDDLIGRGGAYARIYELQLKDQEELLARAMA